MEGTKRKSKWKESIKVGDWQTMAKFVSRMMARSFPQHVLSFDEIESVALEGAWKGHMTWFEDGGLNWHDWVARKARNTVLDHFRDCGPLTRLGNTRYSTMCLSIVEETARRRLKNHPGKHRKVWEPMDEDSQPAHHFLTLDAFEDRLRGLGEKSKQMLRWYFCDDVPMREIGDRLGLSESRVSQSIAGALDFLREREGVTA